MSDDTQMRSTPDDVRPGTSLYYEGGRTGLLLLHGLGGTPNELKSVAIGLAQSGFTVACPRLAGHCSDNETLSLSRWQDWYLSAEEELNRLSRQCDFVIVGGLSMGAVLAMLVAARHTEKVHGLALYAPSLWLDGWSVPWYAGLFRLVRHKWLANFFQFTERDPFGIKDPRIRAFVKTAILSGDGAIAGQAFVPGGAMLEMRWMTDAVLAELDRITQPAIILHPRSDDRASLANALFLQQNLHSVVETVVLEDSYHVITIDRQRQLVAELTAEFAHRVAMGLPDVRSGPDFDEEAAA